MERYEVEILFGALPDFAEATLSGYGDGSGSGSGDGSGYGSGEINWLSTLAASLCLWSERQRARWSELLRSDLTLAFWKSDSQGLPSNGGRSSNPASIGRIEKIHGPLEICTSRGLHATVKPESYQGERIWVVALHGEVQWNGDKCASLEREIVGELIHAK